jgi:hypothetical protein
MYVVVLLTALNVGAATAETPPNAPMAIDQTLTPIVYTLTTDSDSNDSWSLGLVAGLIGEAYRKSHEQFLSALRKTTEGDAASLLRPLACMGITNPAAACRRLIRLEPTDPKVAPSSELAEVLRGLPVHAAIVVDMQIFFDGRFFQVLATEHTAELASDGSVAPGPDVIVNYMNTYSRKMHQQDIDSHRNDSPLAGKLGSKEARMHFWFGGSSPRIMSEMDSSVSLIAQFYGATLLKNGPGALSVENLHRELLPLVRDLLGPDKSKCNYMHGQLLVVREVGDYLWLASGPKFKALLNRFFIEPRCGFDY